MKRLVGLFIFHPFFVDCHFDIYFVFYKEKNTTIYLHFFSFERKCVVYLHLQQYS